MKVAIDLTALLPKRSGVDTYLVGLVSALGKIDDETEYTVYVNREDGEALSLPANFAVVAASRRPRAARLTFQQAVLPAAAFARRVDVVHSPSFIMPLYRGRQAHVLTVHDLTSFTRPECHTRLRRSWAYRSAIAASIRRADRVIVPSAHVAAEVRRLFPWADPRCIAVIPSGVDEAFGGSAVRDDARARERLGLCAPYVLYLGTLEPRKNLAALVGAYHELAQIGIEEDLVLAGQIGWGDTGLASALDAPDLRGRVHVTGYVDDADLPALYAGARAFVYPSLEEGFGFPPLEAMASGVPTIASDSSSLRENLDGAAELVPPGDSSALAAAIRRVLTDEGLRARLRRAGLARAASFTWERTARETLACYEELAGTAPAPRRLRPRARVAPTGRRILFVCSHLRVGGAQRQWWLLIPALAERGWEPHVVALEDEGEFYADLRARGIKVSCMSMRNRGDLAAVRRALTAARLDPAVVLTHGVRAQIVGHLLARRCGVPHVTADHRAPGFRFKPHRELLLRAVAPRVDRVVAVTPRQVPQILRRRYRPDAIRVIPNGFARPRLATTKSREETRSALGLPADAFVAILAAVLRPEKRAALFVRAVSRANRLYPSVRGVVAGYGPELDTIRGLAATTDDAVLVLGHRDDVGDLLCAADVACLSSTAEAASMSALEAMAFGLPIVATNVGGMDEIVVDGTTGLLVPDGDEEALALRIAELAADRAWARSLGEEGRRRQEREFTLTRMVDGYEQLLLEAAVA